MITGDPLAIVVDRSYTIVTFLAPTLSYFISIHIVVCTYIYVCISIYFPFVYMQNISSKIFYNYFLKNCKDKDNTRFSFLNVLRFTRAFYMTDRIFHSIIVKQYAYIACFN